MSREQSRRSRNRRNKGKKMTIFTVVALLSISLVSCNWDQIISEFGQGISSTSEVETSKQSSEFSSESISSSESEITSEQIRESELASLREQLIDTPDAHSSDWNLILVNRFNQLEDDLSFEQAIIENGFIIDARIQNELEQMLADGREQGLDFIVVSTYRTLAQQQANYDSVYQSYINQGRSHDEAVTMTEEYIALPSASEHSTGLAIDITEPVLYQQGEGGLVDAFDQTPEGQWLYQNAADYGFVLRYPKGKEDITIINYESWHFRYVGVENATYMAENNLTLEEYVEILENNEELREEIEVSGD